MEATRWRLRISGAVQHALHVRWDELLRYPTVTSISDFHCVEGWSVVDCAWTGVPFQEFVQAVQPTPQARFVTIHGADGYTTCLPLDALQQPDVLLAYQLDGEPLLPELGGPVRLVVPQKYAYKSVMWVTRLHFTAKATRGYWERMGYSQSADVWTNDRYAQEPRRII